ncbi:glycine cleavage system aminomethyltransferase GcvT [Desulfovibrio inopinatus]|uniref:glycine cleavage system aminomethyltransferase GcvT n=1 Tax=Desulfovibrio inopinatus TaxID=102109 RepID=UPI00040C2893|nr:glycine cleavage system aminomethyltransferase GcvT [Desulfovibrio inopinatus]
METLKVTPLTEWHKAHDAKMAPFAGYDMPIQYTKILTEHEQTRTKAGVFDICHMGEFLISGENAAQALGKVVTHNLTTLMPGRCRYGFLLNPEGGILDDLIIYCLEQDRYMLVVNAARTALDYDWLKKHLPEHITLEDISDQTAKIDLQGPRSYAVLTSVLGQNIELKYFNFTTLSYEGENLLVSRTGYTGELGFEFYLPVSKALGLWEALIAHNDVEPVGLGARDTLRLEMGLPLYGQDLDEHHTPSEAGMTWLPASDADYVGKSQSSTIRQRLVPLVIEGRRSARHHDAVKDASDNTVGVVTSGSFAPSLGHVVALAYINADAADQDAFFIEASRTKLEAKKTELPFYKKGTARIKLEDAQ